MKVKRICLGLMFVGLATLGLSGCKRSPCEKYLTNAPYIPPTKLIHPPKPISPFQLRQYYICILQKHGVQVIRLGQTWKLVFPSDDVFDNDTSELNENYLPILKTAAAFIRTYSTISVEVAAYSNKINDDIKTKFGSITDELTTRQSESVLKYLTTQNTHARFIHAIGKGGHDSVAWNGSEPGRRLNRRVEISFRYYRDNTAWY